MSWQSAIITLIIASLIRPAILVAAAWLFILVFRIQHPASRHAVWTAVLIGMLLVPGVSVLAPQWKLPVLPAKHESTQQIRPVLSASTSVPSSAPRRPMVEPAVPAVRSSLTGDDVLVSCYLAGLAAMMAYRFLGWTLMRRLLSRSRRLRGGRLRDSGDVISPVAVGVVNPTVLLPSGWCDWDSDTRRAVLAHEFAHIRRQDALVSAVARFAKCVLWFHPVAWWLSRTLSNLAELACDAAALERTNDPARYTRILIHFADLANRAGHRVALPGLAMAARSGMGRRIDQIFEISASEPKKLKRPMAVLIMMGAPILCLVAIVGLGEAVALPAQLPFIPALPRPVQVAQVPSPAPARIPTPPKAPSATPAPQDVPREIAPVVLGLMIDISGSMRDHRTMMNLAAQAVVNSSDPRDQVFIVNFNDEWFLYQPFTSDRQKLESAIQKTEARGGSAMRDALYSAIEYSASITAGTKALIVITDGDDNTSRQRMPELIQKAQSNGVAIYILGLLNDDKPEQRRIAQRTLSALTQGTGGLDFYPRDLAELDRALEQIERQIRDRARTLK